MLERKEFVSNNRVHPDEAVAYGAPVQASILSGLKNTSPKDITPLSLGKSVINDVMSVITPRNTRIPVARERRYITTVDNQTSMGIDVYEEEWSKASDNNLLGEFTVEGIPPAPRGVGTVSVDAAGILNVSTMEVTTGERTSATITNDEGRLSKNEIEGMILVAERFKEEDKFRKAMTIRQRRWEIERFTNREDEYNYCTPHLVSTALMDEQSSAPFFGPPTNIYSGLNRDEIERISEELEAQHQIGTMRHRNVAYRRYVPLRKQQLFDRLVSLYMGLFTAHWFHFKHAIEAVDDIPLFFANDRVRFLTTCYISSWFWDLYATLRECVKNVSGTAYNERYIIEMTHISDRYDPFLQHLNSIIRPTHITMGLEDALYIPIIDENPRPDNDHMNAFSIAGFCINENVTQGIISIMGNRNSIFVTIPLGTHNLGRPGWLFDYRLGVAYAWFPMETNFSRADLVAPHILGIPCTPRLGPRDTDEWQFFPSGMLPPTVNANDYRRILPRSFFGSAEYTTIEHERYTFPFETDSSVQSGKRPRQDQIGLRFQPSGSTSLESQEFSGPQMYDPRSFTAYRYRLVTWTNHMQVTIQADSQSRNMAFRNFIIDGARTNQ